MRDSIITFLGGFIIVWFLLLLVGTLPSTCKHDGCNNKALKDSRYCASHDYTYQKARIYDQNHSSNSYTSGNTSKNKSSTTKSYTSDEQKKSSTTSKKSSTSSSNKKSSSQKSSNSKKSMPDCDDYESYDDFMDDWDGCMPDGSDAEDYWENW